MFGSAAAAPPPETESLKSRMDKIRAMTEVQYEIWLYKQEEAARSRYREHCRTTTGPRNSDTESAFLLGAMLF